MIKKLLFIFILCLFSNSGVALAQMAPIFSDVSATHPNFVAIKLLKEQGVLSGYPDGSFKPDALVNRAEALKILLLGKPVTVPSTALKSSFPDVDAGSWYAPYVETAKTLNVVSGNDDGTFAPARTVVRAEFCKMLLRLNNFIADNWTAKQLYADVPLGVWFTAYLNYAGQSGLLTADAKNMLYPAAELSRGEVAEIMYIMTIILNDKNASLLISQTEMQLAQIEIYLTVDNLPAAKRASSLAVDMSQQALAVSPDDKTVLSAAKIAKAYNFLMNSYLAALQKDNAAARDWANQAIAKASEAIEVKVDVQDVADHIKGRANEIIGQLPQS